VTDTVTRHLPPPPPPPGEGPARRDIRKTPAPAIAMVAGLLALGIFVSWGLVVVIVAIVGMIFLHELGHFVAAKRGGMKVTEFFIGFGPRLWSFRRGETEYGLKLLPAGAYVKVIGMHNLEEVPPEDEPRTYRQASYPRRMAVALAGSTMHFLLAGCGSVTIPSPSTASRSVGSPTCPITSSARVGSRSRSHGSATAR
jgi:membrane-associated protease RseP (regulator of RpoE activity)